jgi:hypothetical protein
MDLKLFPYNGPVQRWQVQVGGTALRLDRNYEIFAQVDKKVMGDREKVEQVCTPKPLPPNVTFMVYEDDGVKERRTNPYGEGLTYVEAWELKKVKLVEASDWNKAIFAMIQALPDAYPVVLMWC